MHIFASTMKVKLSHYLITTLLTIFMSACNNDIFIEKLVLSTDYVKLGPDWLGYENQCIWQRLGYS